MPVKIGLQQRVRKKVFRHNHTHRHRGPPHGPRLHSLTTRRPIRTCRLTPQHGLPIQLQLTLIRVRHDRIPSFLLSRAGSTTRHNMLCRRTHGPCLRATFMCAHMLHPGHRGGSFFISTLTGHGRFILFTRGAGTGQVGTAFMLRCSRRTHFM